MSLIDVIEQVRTTPPFTPPGCPFPDLRLVCSVSDAIAWNRHEIERELGFEVPPELTALWDDCGGLVVCEDSMFRQSGAVVLPPHEAVSKTREYFAWKGDEAVPGDLVFAKFWGTLELALIRCDREANDHRRIMIVGEIDPREAWRSPARSIEEFIARLLAAHGDKYWDPRYDEIVKARSQQ